MLPGLEQSFLGAETLPARAGRRRIWIGHLEAAFLQRVDVVQF